MQQLFEATRLGPMELKNRVVRSATNEHLSQPDGQLTVAWAEAQIELAENEVGLVITGHLTVDGTQRADLGQPVIDEKIDQGLLKLAADGVHRAGGRLVAQISHTGGKAPVAVNGRPPKSPVDFSLEELDQLVERFALAAKICKAAGLDGVQIHNAHGYLLSQCLNPKENLRQDEYGGSLENRFRLPRRIIDAVREACGKDFALLVKADANGCGDLHALLKLYEQAGVDGVEVSGLDFATRVKEKTPFFVDALTAAREGISITVWPVGGVFSRATAQQVLDGGFPLVSFSRAFICQPDFAAKLKSGEMEEAACLACNNCFKVYRQRPVRCILHKKPVPQLEVLFGPY